MQLYLYCFVLLCASALGAFFYGQHVQSDHDKAQVLVAQRQADKAGKKQGAIDEQRDLAAANEIQHLNAANDLLQQQIRETTLTGGHIHVSPVSPLCPAVLNPLSAPLFRLLYDAGSRGDASATTPNHMPARHS